MTSTNVHSILTVVATKARDWASNYAVASDGRNTFILFAEWAESLQRKLTQEQPMQETDIQIELNVISARDKEPVVLERWAVEECLKYLIAYQKGRPTLIPTGLINLLRSKVDPDYQRSQFIQRVDTWLSIPGNDTNPAAPLVAELRRMIDTGGKP